MASHSIVNTRAVDDLVIDEDDQFLPKTKTSRSSTPSSSSNTPSTSVSASDTDEEPAGLVKDTIIKGMCMCLFSGTADLRKLNFKKIEIDFTTFFFWFTLFCINMMEVQQTQIVFNNILIISSKSFFKALHIGQRQFLSNFFLKIHRVSKVRFMRFY